MNNKKWTTEEEERLIAIISENSGNLANAFRQFSNEFPHRTPGAAMYRWYGILRIKNDVKVCMVTIDKKHKYVNRKNINSDFSLNKMRKGIWGKVINLIFGKK